MFIKPLCLLLTVLALTAVASTDQVNQIQSPPTQGYLQLRATWWNTMTAAQKTIVVRSVIAGAQYVHVMDSTQRIMNQTMNAMKQRAGGPWQVASSKTLQFSKPLSEYVQALDLYYSTHKGDEESLPIAQVLGCLSDDPYGGADWCSASLKMR